jgi:hypothetical protein
VFPSLGAGPAESLSLLMLSQAELCGGYTVRHGYTVPGNSVQAHAMIIHDNLPFEKRYDNESRASLGATRTQ